MSDTPTPTPTPKTDAAVSDGVFHPEDVRPAIAFARTLERELAAANQRADDMEEEAEAWRIEAQIAQYRLAGKRHPRDNGIVAPDEIVTHLATVLRNIRSTWGGMVVTEDCKCDDCEFLRPIDTALAMVEGREG